LCVVDEAEAVCREMARVVRPGGVLVVGELGRWSLWAATRRVRAWFGSQLWRRGRFRTASELWSLVNGAGLMPGPVHGSIYYPRGTWAARLLAPYDAALSRLTTFGAAFLALAAVKPATTGKQQIA